jgi:hypothetical protein
LFGLIRWSRTFFAWTRLALCIGDRLRIEENAMPEAQSDIDYTVDIGRHETTFRANTAKGEEFLGGVELTMSNEEAHKFMQDARAAGLTVKSFF